MSDIKKNYASQVSVAEIRNLFLDFFNKNNHQIIPSSSLVPTDDPTLMFTSAGMVQFKNLFTGISKEAYTKAASSQKCLRAGGKHNDLDNVGYTARHHTFFEMLGNFSFGDYFKDEAIEYAWSFLTKELKLSPDRLYITVYHDDNKAFDIWKKITGFSDDKIIRISTSDNFWSAGDTGPCGPCSEIFYDHGDHIEGGLPGSVNEDGDRFVEIWNLVFMQYEQLEGERILLPRPSIDTGMGLERISAVMQNVSNNYDIDIFRNLIKYAEDIIKTKIDEENIAAYRVIADHIRACAFLISDGVNPSNEGRGYVLRRIIRRASRYINQLSYKKPLLGQLLQPLIESMGEAYPELIRGKDLITQILTQEEEKFRDTLDRGMKLLNTELSNLGNEKTLSAEATFKLYDTYGFPIDLTKDILRNKNLKLDEEGFYNLMQKQKEQARASWIGSGAKSTDVIWYDLNNEYNSTEFLGYDLEKAEGQVQAIIKDNVKLNEIKEGEFYLLINQTVFYPESGGQVGDIGIIYNKTGKITVLDTKKYLNIIIHHCKLEEGSIKTNDIVTLEIDTLNRNKIRSNHSATHLLHAALRKILGTHIAQKGSLVTASKLRFDISHPQALSREEKEEVENLVNQMIIKNSKVTTVLSKTDEAIKLGAMALFGEKYDQEARVVSIGTKEDDMHFSVELCGGTHIKSTGDIGIFKIISESALASGIRRIEAVTGLEALKYIQSEEYILNNILRALKSNKNDVEAKIESLIKDKRELEKSLANMKKLSTSDTQKNSKSEIIKNINFTYEQVNNINSKELRNIALDFVQNKVSSLFVIFSLEEEKISFVIALTKDIISQFDASFIAKEVSNILGGRGAGGKKELAQGGGVIINNINNALEKIRNIINIS